MSASTIRTARRSITLAAAGCLTAGLAAAFAGCGQLTPIIPEGAWAVSFIQPNAIDCQIANHNTAIGEVSADQRANLVEDEEVQGGFKVSVVCSVVPKDGKFKVSANETSENGSYLTLSIPELDPKATVDKPSLGVVSYQSQNTAKTFSQSDCAFYFLKGQSVDDGEIFITFECDKIAAGGDNICQIKPGYAAFSKCATTEQ